MDIQEKKQMYIDTWNMTNKRPLLSLIAPKDKQVWRKISKPASVRERWINTSYVIAHARMCIENTCYGGDAIPMFNPNLGPDILGAIMGCELEFGESTSWARHYVTDWEQAGKIAFDSSNWYWLKIKEITEKALEDSRGDYLVGITDLHAGLDALVSLRGPEALCTDLLDCPKTVKESIWKVFEVFKEVYDRLYSIIAARQEGTVNWMGVWHPSRAYPTSCDFSCLISPADFREFVVPELLAQLDFLDASIYHLDGLGALRHLDPLCAIPQLKGIQWVPGAGSKPAREWLDVLKKIQDAGKIIQITIEPEDLIPICKNLDPRGLMLDCYCISEQQADEMIAYVKRCYS